MTARQRLLPLAIISVFGGGVTYFLVKPAITTGREERQARAERRREIWQTRYDDLSGAGSTGRDSQAPSPETMLRKTEENVANAGGATRIPKDAPRWAEVQEGQFAEYKGTFKWRDVPLDRHSEKKARPVATRSRQDAPRVAEVRESEFVAKSTDMYEQRDIPTERISSRDGARNLLRKRS